MNRRNFIKGGVVAACSTALYASLAGDESRAGTTGIEGYDYRQPSFAKGSRILFQGDSITFIGRRETRNDYLGHNFVYLIASRLGADIPNAQLDFYNRGMNGHTISKLRDRWQVDAIDLKPDLLSILVGANDSIRSTPADSFESDYRFLLDASKAANPALRLVLMDPFILPVGGYANKSVWIPMRAAADELRVRVAKLARDYDAVHVRMQEVFDAAAEKVSPEYWLWDGIHPLPQGHELLARKWIEEVSARWPLA